MLMHHSYTYQTLTYSNTRHPLQINAVCLGLADRSSGLWYLLAEMVLDSFEDIGNSSHYNYKVRKLLKWSAISHNMQV